MKKTIYPVLFFLSALSLSSCSETDYPTFDDSTIDIYFTKDSTFYSFGITPLEYTAHIVELPIKIIGGPVGQDRQVKVAIINERTNARPEVHYRLPENIVIPADSVNGVLPVTVIREELGETETAWKMAVRLIANENFSPTLQQERKISCEALVTFNNVVSKPNWTDWQGNFAWMENYLGPWNPTVYVVFMDFFHKLEKTAPTTYQNLVERYGENLDQSYYTGWDVKNFGGWDWDFDYTLRKHVLIPMYQYFQEHPELEVTDFPNPLK